MKEYEIKEAFNKLRQKNEKEHFGHTKETIEEQALILGLLEHAIITVTSMAKSLEDIAAYARDNTQPSIEPDQQRFDV